MALFYFVFQCGMSDNEVGAEADGDVCVAESDLDFPVITVGLQLFIWES